ncbi:MAG: class I SAM-dependent methyltransferase [Candidatus Heimdallarchaeaceae archaeon]
MPKKPKKRIIEERYNATADFYDDRYTEIQNSKYRAVFKNCLTSEILEPIIDIGGGTGLLIEYLAPDYKDIWCVDLSFQMLKKGKNKRSTGNFICADSDALPLKSNSIHTVTSFTMLQNLPSPSKTIEEFHRIMRPRSLICLTFLTKNLTKEDIIPQFQRYFRIKKAWNLPVEDVAIIAKKNKRRRESLLRDV